MILVNADDFGWSPAVNGAIEKALCIDGLQQASLMANSCFFSEAVDIAKQFSGIKLGLHVTLTSGRPISAPHEVALLINRQGYFKHGFVSLLMASLLPFCSKLKLQIKHEIKNQLHVLLKNGIQVNHIDSHRHVHAIPLIHKIVTEVAGEHNIKVVRQFNEQLMYCLKVTRSYSFLWNGRIFIFILLRFLALFHKQRTTDLYTFGLLFGLHMRKEYLERSFVPYGYRAVEVIMHPGLERKFDLATSF